MANPHASTTWWGYKKYAMTITRWPTYFMFRNVRTESPAQGHGRQVRPATGRVPMVVTTWNISYKTLNP